MIEDTIILGRKKYNGDDWILRKEFIGDSYINMEKAHHIAMCVNDDYVKWAGVFMESVMVKNPWLKNLLCFHLLVDMVNEEDKNKLKEFSDRWNISIALYFMNDKNMDNFSQFGVTTKNGKILYSFYYRWLIPYVVDKSIDKVLYIDVDSVCNSDIRQVLQEKFSEPILVVRDNYMFREANADRLNIKAGDYFCGGLSYLNIHKMKREHIVEKILQYLCDCVKRHIDLPLAEQDAANLILDGNAKIADDSYHYSIVLENKEMLKDRMPKGINNAYFVHFMGKAKPWRVESQDFSITQVWLNAKANSEWRDVPLVVSWNQKAYRAAAIAAWINKDYTKWAGYKISSFFWRMRNLFGPKEKS